MRHGSDSDIGRSSREDRRRRAARERQRRGLGLERLEERRVMDASPWDEIKFDGSFADGQTLNPATLAAAGETTQFSLLDVNRNLLLDTSGNVRYPKVAFPNIAQMQDFGLALQPYIVEGGEKKIRSFRIIFSNPVSAVRFMALSAQEGYSVLPFSNAANPVGSTLAASDYVQACFAGDDGSAASCTGTVLTSRRVVDLHVTGNTLIAGLDIMTTHGTFAQDGGPENFDNFQFRTLPQILATLVEGNLNLRETGDTVRHVDVRLDGPPIPPKIYDWDATTWQVQVDASASDASELVVNPSAMVFSQSDWNSGNATINPKRLTVSSVDDSIADGDQQVKVTLAINDPQSNDVFDVARNLDLPVTVQDDDPTINPAIIVNESGGTSVTEGGGVDSYAVSLSTSPSSPVTLRISANSQTVVSLSSSGGFSTFVDVVLSSVNGALVYVKAVDDSFVEGNHSEILRHQVISSSVPEYPNGMVGPQVVVSITDNDQHPTIDFGDAPDSYGTTLVANGARHVASGPRLGNARDAEADGAPSTLSNGDDSVGTTPDDEDGVVLPPLWIGMQRAPFQLHVSGAANGALVDAWIDLDGNGRFDAAYEQVASSFPVHDGTNTLFVDLPNTVRSGDTFARFRISSNGGLAPTGAAADGEVEDYRLTIQAGGGVGVLVEGTEDLGRGDSRAVAAGDVDGDGDVDLLIGDALGAPGAFLWRNDGRGHYTVDPLPLTNESTWETALVDLDGDNDLDAVTVGGEGVVGRVWRNDGTGTFLDTGMILDGDGITTELVAADMNGDGSPDLVVNRPAGSGAVVWINTGTGLFVRGASPGQMLALAVADVDHDGDLDLIASQGAQQIVVHRNNGVGQLTPDSQAITLGSTGYSLAAADLDHDGDSDLVVGTGRGVQVLFNLGTGTFADSGQRIGSSVVWDVKVGDLNGDTHLDVFAAQSDPLAGAAEAVLLNDGTGDFTDSNQTFPERDSKNAELVDVDGDHDLDVIVVRGDSQPNKVWFNALPTTGELTGVSYVDRDGNGSRDEGAMFSASQTQSDAIHRLRTPRFQFDQLPMPLGPILVTIVAENGDLDGAEEMMGVKLDDTLYATLFEEVANWGTMTAQWAVPVEEFAALVKDGSLSVDLFYPPRVDISPFPSARVTVSLSYLTDSAARESGTPYVNVYLDSNLNESWDGGEPITTTLDDDPRTAADETGTYRFPDLIPGTYSVRQVLPTHFRQTEPASGEYDVSLAAGNVVTDLNWGVQDAFAGLVRFHFVVTDLYGTPTSAVAQGQEFLVNLYVEDVSAAQQGVYSSFADVVWPANLATVVSSIEIGGAYPNFQSGDASVAGTLDEVGGVANFTHLGGDPQVLATFRMRADATGLLKLTTNPADQMPMHSVVLFDPHKVVAANDIDYGFAYVRIVDEHPPAAQSDDYSTDEDTNLIVNATLGVLANDSDADGDTLVAELVEGPRHGVLTLNRDGSFLYAPSPDFAGSDSFVYRAFDGLLSSPPTTVSLAVNSVNDPPVGQDDGPFLVARGGTLTLTRDELLGNDIDSEGDSLSLVITAWPQHGTLVEHGVDGTFVYRPDPGFVGADSFEYLTFDGQSYSLVPSIVEIDVFAPDVQILPRIVDEDGNSVTTAALHDELYLAVYVVDLRSPAIGVHAGYTDVTYDLGRVRMSGPIEPGPSYPHATSGDLSMAGIIDEAGGEDNFGPLGGGLVLLFRVRFTPTALGTAIFATDPAELFVHDVLLFGEDDPVASYRIEYGTTSLDIGLPLEPADDSAQVDEDSRSNRIDVLTNDAVITNRVVTISHVGPTDNGGTVVIAPDGDYVTYTPAADYYGPDGFIYELSLEGLPAGRAFVSIDVAEVNDPPRASDDDYVAIAGVVSELDVLANDTIAPDRNETLTIVSAGPTSLGGQVTVAPSGDRLTYVAPTSITGVDTFTYVVSDGRGGFDTATVSVKSSVGWTNPRNPLDVNDDGWVTPLDALIVINHLNSLGAGRLPTPPAPFGPPPYLDPTNDDFASPLDALRIINYLNGIPGAEGEDDSFEPELELRPGIRNNSAWEFLVDESFESIIDEWSF